MRNRFRSAMEEIRTRFPGASFDRQRWGNLAAIAENIAWLSGDRVFRMGVGFLLGAAVARYLGPTDFGVLTLALAVADLACVFCALGFDGLLGRELVRRPEMTLELLGTGFWSSLTAMLVLYGAVIVPVALLGSSGPVASQSLLLAGLLTLRAPFSVLNLQFSVQLRAGYGVLAANGAFLLSAGVRLWLIFQGASVVPFVAALLIEPVGAAIMLYAFYRRAGYRVSDWRWSGNLAKQLIRESWPLLLSGFATLVYMRIDQIMLAFLRGGAEVGLYGAVLRFSEVWYFFPMALGSSLLPALVRSRERGQEAFQKRMQRYYDLNAALAYGLIFALVPASPWLFPLVFGPDYAGGGTVLQIHVWACLFVFLGFARSQYLTIEGWTRFVLFSSLVGALVNIGLNLAFIPRWGVTGAAIATVISQAVASFLSSFMWGPVRRNGWAQARALLVPVRVIGWVWRRASRAVDGAGAVNPRLLP